MQQDDIIIDGPLLGRVFRRQIRAWAPKGLLLFGGLLLLALFLVPRSYTSSVSLAIQQPAASGSALAMLTGGGGTNKRYLGVLKSREAAEQVERHVHLQQLYDLPTEADAIERLMKSIKPEDNATDGLLYVTVTLPGPPRFSFTHSPRETQIKAAAAQTANAYALALKEYYLTSDTDQGAVLLRGADKEVRQARADYDASLTQALDFSRGLRHVDPRSAPTSATDNADSAVTGLGALYSSLAQVEGQLRSDQAARQTRQTLVNAQISNLPSLPTDDPLLAEARGKVTQDQADYNTYFNLYGPENPRVITARTRLAVDQAQLHRQIQGIKGNLTTPNIQSDELIQGLYAKEAILQQQIAQAERRLGVRRELSGEFARLQTEVMLRLEVLKTTLTEAAKVRLENVSAMNRMSVIDSALPPKYGEPGWLRLSAACLGLVVLLFLVAVMSEYLSASRAASAAAPPGAGSNGSGTAIETGKTATSGAATR